MTKAEYKKWVKKLQPYWKEREKLYDEFRAGEARIEAEMQKETGEELEFFYGEMHEGCVGIGHVDLERRNREKKNYFPLIHDMDLGEWR